MTSEVAKIEVLGRDHMVELVYFPLPAVIKKYWAYHRAVSVREELLFSVNRDNPEEKVTDFMERVSTHLEPVLNHEDHLMELTKGGLLGNALFLIARHNWDWRRLLLLLSVLQNTHLITTSGNYHTDLTDGAGVVLPMSHLVCCVLLLISELLCSAWLNVRSGLSRNRQRVKDRQPLPPAGVAPRRTAAGEDKQHRPGGLRGLLAPQVKYALTNAKVLRWLNVVLFWKTKEEVRTAVPTWFWVARYAGRDGPTMVTVAQLMCSTAGFNGYPIFYVLGLADIAAQSRTMLDVVRAVVQNADKLATACVLAVLVLYMYSSVGYYDSDLRNNYQFEDRADCDTLLKCFLTHISYGFLHPPLYDEDPDAGSPPGYPPVGVLWYFVSYNLFVNMGLTAIVSGIIIDSFSELRQNVSARVGGGCAAFGGCVCEVLGTASLPQ